MVWLSSIYDEKGRHEKARDERMYPHDGLPSIANRYAKSVTGLS